MQGELKEWSTTPLVNPTKAVVEIDGEVVFEEEVDVGKKATVRFESQGDARVGLGEDASDGGVSITTAIKSAIDDHESANGAPIDDVVDAVAEDFPRDEVEDALERLKKRGEVYKPNDDALRVT